jgi:hypothetical protein
VCSVEMMYGQLLFEKVAAEEAQRDAGLKEVAELVPSPASEPSATFDVGRLLFEFLRGRGRSDLLAGRYNRSSARGNDRG